MLHRYKSVFFRTCLLMLMIAPLALSQRATAQVLVDDAVNADSLVRKLVGTGISYSNAVLNCPPGASATYKVIASNLGIDSGIVLTSGKAKTDPTNPFGGAGVNGAQQLYFAATSNNTGGDAQLSVLAGINTFDACILEFDFVPDGDSLKFNYVFGSEEYDNYSCATVNDVFGFFLSGPGYPTATNLALIPGTSVPVCISTTTDTSINTPQSINLCSSYAPGQSPFGQYYHDNQNDTTITYWGLTTVLEAQAAVVPCQTYHIKLAIADGGDGTLDSGVFLEENSFRSSKLELSLQSSLGENFPFLVEGCTNGVIVAKRNKAFPAPQKFYLSYTGSAIRGIDYNMTPDSLIIPSNDTQVSFTITPVGDGVYEGVEYINVNIINACNGQIIQSITFPVYDFLPLNVASPDTLVCQGSTVNLVAVGDPLYYINWSSKPDALIANRDALTTTAVVDTTTDFILTGKFATCLSDSVHFLAKVQPNPIVDIFKSEITECLTDSITIYTDVQPDWYKDYLFNWTPADWLSDPTVQEPRFFRSDYMDQLYVLTVTSPEIGCKGSDSILIHTRPPFDLTNLTADQTIFFGDSIRLNADGAKYYVWTPPLWIDDPNSKMPIASPKERTQYTVYGINQYGCRDTGYVNIDINYTMSEFIPNAFSPNGDGRNDVFRLKGIRFQELQEFRIFNRWGQQIFSTTNPEGGWDGTVGGKPAEIGTYTYLIRVGRPDGTARSYKGDVILIR